MGYSANMLSIGILGFFISSALGSGVVLVRHEVRATGGDEHRILDLCFWLLIGTIVGARLFDAMLRPGASTADPLQILRFWNGTSFYYDGAAAAAATGILFVKRHRLPLWKTSDLFGPSLAIGHFLVYIGIFFSGQGLDESFSLGPNLILTRTGDGLIGALPRPNPAALYSACVSFAIFGVLLIVKKRRHFDGQVFWTFVLLNGGLQLTLAIWVFSGARLLHGGAPSPSTLIGAFVVTASLAMLIRLRRRARRAAAALE